MTVNVDPLIVALVTGVSIRSIVSPGKRPEIAPEKLAGKSSVREPFPPVKSAAAVDAPPRIRFAIVPTSRWPVPVTEPVTRSVPPLAAIAAGIGDRTGYRAGTRKRAVHTHRHRPAIGIDGAAIEHQRAAVDRQQSAIDRLERADPTGYNASGYSAALPAETLTITGVVASPQSGTPVITAPATATVG